MAFFDDKELFGDTEEESISTGMAEETGFILKRSRYKAKDGNAYWMYFAEGLFRGNKVVINFTCTKKDRVSYDQISYVFSIYGADPVPIYYEESSFKDSDGRKVKTTKYFVLFRDEDDELGGEIRIALKPKNESDKTFWNYFMERMKKKKELEAAQKAESDERAAQEASKQSEGKTPKTKAAAGTAE